MAHGPKRYDFIGGGGGTALSRSLVCFCRVPVPNANQHVSRIIDVMLLLANGSKLYWVSRDSKVIYVVYCVLLLATTYH